MSVIYWFFPKQLFACWLSAKLKRKLLSLLNWRRGSSSGDRMYFCPSFFLHTRSWRLFLQTRGCCTHGVANTLEQEATVSMKVHEMEADSGKGKQYFGWGLFWWPIRPRCLYDLPLPLPAFMCLGLLCGTQWPLIKDWAQALRQPWRHSYQMPSSQNSKSLPEINGLKFSPIRRKCIWTWTEILLVLQRPIHY